MDANNISIWDGSLDAELTDALNAFSKKPIWQYGWKSNVERDNYFFWHSHFAGGDTHSVLDCESALSERRILLPIEMLWKEIKSKLSGGHSLVRAYGNAHTFGAEGYTHVDSDDARSVSTIYYAHDVWEADWGGELNFFDKNSEVFKSVSPLPGRIVSFPGNVMHRACSLSRICPALRVSFVFKSIIKDGVSI